MVSAWSSISAAVRERVTASNYTAWVEPLEVAGETEDAIVLRGEPGMCRDAIARCAFGSAGKMVLYEDEEDGTQDRHASSSVMASFGLADIEPLLTGWRVMGAAKLLAEAGADRMMAAVLYIRSRRDVRNPGAYLRRLLRDDEIPEPIAWVD